MAGVACVQVDCTLSARRNVVGGQLGLLVS